MFRPAEYPEVPYLDLLSWIFGNDEFDHGKPIFIDAHNSSRRISHREAKSYVTRLIAGFRAMGLQPGDGVCVNSFNNIYYALIYLAIIGAGGCYVGSNPAYTSYELDHLFSISNTKFVIVEPELLKNVVSSAEKSKIPPDNVIVFNVHGERCPDGKYSWERLLEHGEQHWCTFNDERRAKSTIAALMSTSGTTGLPKAAALSHYALIAQNILYYDSRDKKYEIVRLMCLPQFHAFAGPLVNFAPLREGHTTYIMKRFNMDQYLEYIDLYSITETAMANPIVFKILNLQHSAKLSSLRFIWIGGSPLAGSTQNKFQNLLPSEAIVAQVYGMTEIGWITTFHFPEKDSTGSVGRLLPGIEAKILDDNSAEINGDGISGQIYVRGPPLMVTYLNNPDATHNTIIDGWLHTGDIGYQRQGKWYIIDRAKEIIKVRGWQVSPTELEACLLTHPHINDAAVIGVNFSDDRGELPRAYVVIDQTAPYPITDKEIKNYLGQRLATYKALAGGVKRVDSITRNAAGKIMKNLLREEATQEIQEQRKLLSEVIAIRDHRFKIERRLILLTLGSFCCLIWGLWDRNWLRKK